MTDLISRADAKKAVYLLGKRPQINDIWECLDNLPSASADAVQGEWKFVDHEVFAGEYFCSICGKRAEVDLYGEWILSNYCPCCGTRMKGGTE